MLEGTRFQIHVLMLAQSPLLLESPLNKKWSPNSQADANSLLVCTFRVSLNTFESS